MLNIYVDETLKTMMPIDWGPSYGDTWGVEEITNSEGDTEKDCEAFLSKRIPEKFSCTDLATLSKNKSLWP